jgi:uncharacterized protein
MRREVKTVDELRAIVGHPNSHVANKVRDRLSPSTAQIAKAMSRSDMSEDELDKHLSEDNLRKVLY